MTSPASTTNPAPLPNSPASAPAPQLASPACPCTKTLWLCLLALTALAAFLRFWRLDYQAYWTDESYTLNRINGTYTFLLNQLAPQGFPPGWYTLLRFWRICLENFLPPGETYQPQYLRMLPAFCGTLTVPAMYLLARQFTDRKGALLVTLLAAVNPFLIYYSRDIKMYAGFWFFAVLNMALFFHWQNTRRHLSLFPLFLLSGVAMTAMHSMAWAMVALQLLFLLTRSRPKAWDAPLWVLAAGAMAVIPVYWYFEFSEPAKWAGRLSNEVDQSMFWIKDYTDMSWRTLAGLPTSHLLGYLWPVYPPDPRLDYWFLLGGEDFTRHLATRSSPWMAQAELWAAVALFAILVLGLIPWRRLCRPAHTPNISALPELTRGRWWWVALWIILPSAALAATWIPTIDDLKEERAPYLMEQTRAHEDYNSARQALAALPDPSPERTKAAADLQQRQAAIQDRQGHIDALNALIDADWSSRLWHTFSKKTPKPLWEPRYLGIILPAWLLWLAAALRRFPTVPLRAALITLVCAASTFSALSNHLIYRNAPFNREAAILEQYIDPKDRFSAAVAVPAVKYPLPAENTATTIARHLVPGSPSDLAYMPFLNPDLRAPQRVPRDPSFWPPKITDANEIITWLKTAVIFNPRLKTIVLTDRDGDLPAPTDPLSNKALANILGPRWKLVHEETYVWHYEWHFYIFHTWRTRVWQLAPITLPTTIPTTTKPTP